MHGGGQAAIRLGQHLAFQHRLAHAHGWPRRVAYALRQRNVQLRWQGQRLDGAAGGGVFVLRRVDATVKIVQLAHGLTALMGMVG